MASNESRREILTLPHKVKFDKKHLNSSLSPSKDTKSRVIAVVKWTFRAKIKVTMTNGGHAHYSLQVVNRAKIIKVLNYAAQHSDLRDYLIIRLPAKTGLRTSEICTLQIQHINFQTARMHVLDSKNKKKYEVPIDIQTTELLKELVIDRSEGYVFIQKTSWKTVKKGKPLTKQTIWVVVRRIGEKAGVPDLKPRDLRYFFAATWARILHGNLVTLQHLLRHDNLATTSGYVNRFVLPEEDEKEYRKLMDPIASQVDNIPLACQGCRFYKPIKELIRHG